MIRLAIYAFFATAAIVSLIWVKNPLAVAVISGLATGLAVPAIDAAVANSRYLRLLLPSIKYFNKDIRVSISYLYRIEDQGQYFLLQGQRLPDQYQPVGGVYKFNLSARGLLHEWGVRTDDLNPY
jgi:UDP-N-acetylmuramyl pentapeptide phosphotransferase/UDP-N-acetylglucosamine-1-phosphate transferase